MIYKWAMILGAVLGICSCSIDDIDSQKFSYQIQGINAYKGQDVASLFDANGAPNTIKRLNNNKMMWVYYTNYRPVGGGEIITYDNPQPNSKSTTCAVKVILKDNLVEQIFTNCS